MSYQSDARRYVRELMRRGWQVVTTGTGHHKAIHISGAFVLFASSPSCHRWKKNTEAKVRKIERGQYDNRKFTA